MAGVPRAACLPVPPNTGGRAARGTPSWYSRPTGRGDAAVPTMITRSRLVLRNLGYHWRGNLAVLLGVAVGTAVLTGALLVGDSLRGSLRDLTEEQLTWVDDALVA